MERGKDEEEDEEEEKMGIKGGFLLRTKKEEEEEEEEEGSLFSLVAIMFLFRSLSLSSFPIMETLLLLLFHFPLLPLSHRKSERCLQDFSSFSEGLEKKSLQKERTKRKNRRGFLGEAAALTKKDRECATRRTEGWKKNAFIKHHRRRRRSFAVRWIGTKKERELQSALSLSLSLSLPPSLLYLGLLSVAVPISSSSSFMFLFCSFFSAPPISVSR